MHYSVLTVGPPRGGELLGVLGFVLSLYPGPYLVQTSQGFPEESATVFQSPELFSKRSRAGWCLFPVNFDNGWVMLHRKMLSLMRIRKGKTERCQSLSTGKGGEGWDRHCTATGLCWPVPCPAA